MSSIHFKEEEAPSLTYDDNEVVLKRKVGSYERKTSKMTVSLFGRLRDSIRQMGNAAMFLYGMPSSNVMDLLARLYNHNVIRASIFENGVPVELSGAGAVQHDYKSMFDFNMMTGVAEVGGKLYITISEDPREDKGYADKIKILVTLLHYANYHVDYDLEELRVPPEKMEQDFGVTRGQLFPDYIPMPYGIPMNKTQFDSFNIGQYLIGGHDHKQFIELSKPKKSVVLIHSFDYLLSRRAGDRGTPSHKSPNAGVTSMYPPFKRLWSSKGSGIYSCNNGSTCAESKMFSYLHAKGMFSGIQGYAAYWLGKSMPPNHIIKGYNYLTTERKHLDELKRAAESVMDPSLSEILNSDSSKGVFDYFIQPFALPCPGCFSNYTNYTKNTFEQIDNSNCFHVKQVGQTIRRRGRRGMQQPLEPLTTDDFKGNGASVVSSKSRKQGGRHKTYHGRSRGRRSRRSRHSHHNTRRRR